MGFIRVAMRYRYNHRSKQISVGILTGFRLGRGTAYNWRHAIVTTTGRTVIPARLAVE